MGAFTPFKRHGNKFNYTPRTYDPVKEAREQRREELYGRRSNQSEMGDEYQPGQYIRSSRAARSARQSSSNTGRKRRSANMWILIAVIIAITYMGSMLYNKLVALFDDSTPRTEQVNEFEEFNPYTPITIVPNDYVEEE